MDAPSQPRQRQFTRRSRAGCRTCRARHVKCDETPDTCQRCVASGLRCEYDLTRLPRPATGRALPRWPRPAAALPPGPGGGSVDERHCFAVFYHHTVPMMASWFDSEVWQRLVLQMSHAEPAVYHAVVALSALHEAAAAGADGEVDGAADGAGRELALAGRSPHHRFALAQYGRAMALLRARLTSHDPLVRRLALTCCVVFGCFELFRGHSETAFVHLQNGARILVSQPHALDPTGPEPALAKVFVHLDLHSAQFSEGGPLLSLDAEAPGLEPIRSVADAKHQLDPIVNQILRFRRAWESLRPEASLGVQELAAGLAEQARIQARLHGHQVAFEAFIAGAPPQALSPKDWRSADVIRMQHLGLANILDTGLVASEMVYDSCLPVYQAITCLAAQITRSFQTGPDGRRPNLVLDMGVIPSLFWVCLKCRDVPTRQRALDLLEAWPHREGAYDSVAMAPIARQHMEREGHFLAGDAAGWVVPESARMASLELGTI
ncbi:hypothetical protein BO71DRAFT_337144 [Aspergillus ellipticus CBS 707.79]|uniref:Zn(2)-C6 fungal-type domain-containing protein n=1 Tax=Aspergillus ellipticus CBS 707.79 TaxID=1448320 RepID=A0A319CVX3_9EURO|nr:hypothetical protein BO71DRAFT_337144 [Aspergillus ellipticus CBS 707.79]